MAQATVPPAQKLALPQKLRHLFTSDMEENG
jgi:hypothetical protein